MSLSPHTDVLPVAVTEAWPDLASARIENVAVGNINQTLRATLDNGAGTVRIVQRLHPIFDATVHHDIAAFTAHLQAHGLITPVLVETVTGTLFCTDADGGVWRMLTYVDGENTERVESPVRAKAAGRLVGRAHEALTSFEHAYNFSRGNVHDTKKHMATLRTALAEHQSHRLFAAVRQVSGPLLVGAKSLPAFDDLPLRHSHGDLKISNLMFASEGEALCLIDLDTVSLMTWPFEMGDALRSWCNPQAEDVRPANFRVDLFAAALEGYAEGARSLPTAAERARLVDGISVIALELAARFLADALNESYFGFDASRYATKGDHHLARGEAMWALHLDVEQKRSALEVAAQNAFGSRA